MNRLIFIFVLVVLASVGTPWGDDLIWSQNQNSSTPVSYQSELDRFAQHIKLQRAKAENRAKEIMESGKYLPLEEVNLLMDDKSGISDVIREFEVMLDMKNQIGTGQFIEYFNKIKSRFQVLKDFFYKGPELAMPDGSKRKIPQRAVISYRNELFKKSGKSSLALSLYDKVLKAYEDFFSFNF